MVFLTSIVVILLALILGVVTWIAFGIRDLIDEAKKSNSFLAARSRYFPMWGHGSFQFPENACSLASHKLAGPYGCWIIWVWRRGSWQLVSKPADVQLGPTPQDRGSYEGEHRKVWSPTNR